MIANPIFTRGSHDNNRLTTATRGGVSISDSVEGCRAINHGIIGDIEGVLNVNCVNI